MTDNRTSDNAKRIADLSPEKRALLASRLKKTSGDGSKSSSIPRREASGSSPLSFAQQRLWFLNQWDPDSPVYNISAAVRLSGRLDVNALERSLNEIARRHEVVRATFTTVKGEPVQVIAPNMKLDVRAVDLQNLPQSEQEAEALRLATEDARQPFDLVHGPLLRTQLLRLSEDEHVALLTMHHIISDGWSVGVLIKEMASLYHAFSSNQPPSLPELPIQYADFADWQRQWLQGEVLDKQLAYWNQRLSGSPLLLELPTDRPRPAFMTYQGAHVVFDLAKSLSESLQARSRQEGCTLFMTLMAAFQTLLSRYTGQDDICVGTPIANRNRTEIEGLIGFFVNTLVVRSDLSSDPTFRDVLRQVRERALEMHAHQDLPFEMLVDVLELERDMSHAPLFQVMFALQDSPLDVLELPGLRLRLLDTDAGTAKFDLTLFIEDRADGLRGTFEYATDLFDAETITRMAGHFQNLLEGIVANPDRRISTLQILSERERHQLLVEWSGERTAYPKDKTIHRLFETQVNETPDAIAVVFEDKSLTYQELNRQANQLAHHLQGLGVGPETLVGILMERSLEMIVAHLGILKAGGAYLPLDPEYPQERLAFMLEDGQVPVLLTQERMLKRVPNRETKVICLDTQWEAIAGESGDNPDSNVTADHLAYVMYTSGSTGRPKGVSVIHRGVVRLVKNTNYAELTSQEVFLQLAPISFDASTLEIWGPLLNGGRVAVMPPQTPSLGDIGRAIEKYHVTTLWLTASLFHSMVDERIEDLRGLRQLLAGGDVLSVAHVTRAIQELDGVKMINGYGPTENTTFTACYRATRPDQIRHTIPIGRPVANTRVYILDANRQPVPIGVCGELYIGGDGLARGYLKRPDLTAEKFVPNPFADQSGAYLYRTGDLARYRCDGNIEFLGRIDDQVKINGIRIEPGEVEAVLGQHPALQDVAVLAREDRPGDKRLVAYLVARQKPAPTAGEMRNFLKEKLPARMIPSAFVFLDELPMTANGKLDRRALPAPDLNRPDLEKTYVAPRTPVEQFLVNKWQEVLRIDRIGVYDNFFELGGNSLQAAVVTNRLQEEIGETAHVRALFMAPTVADLALYLNEYYPSAAAKMGGTESVDHVPSRIAPITASSALEGGIDAAKVAQLRRLIPPLRPRATNATATQLKNPPAIFVLSPPRSGSTLLRVMLGGNPRLFSPPELDLLSFNTLAERKATFSGKYSFWLEGPIRAIMEIKGCDAEQAQAIMRDFEDKNLTTQEFYRELQGWIGDRLLVDKTPVYPLDWEVLKRAESDFENARYIHLARHPYATIYSFVEARLEEIFFRHEHPFSMRELAELVWIVCHQNILEFLAGIPDERQHRVWFEELVSQPQSVMEGICEFLGIDFHPDMLRPYQGDKMTTGIRPGHQMVGDFKFYVRNQIDPKAADRWKKFKVGDFLSDIAWETAAQLGYEKLSNTDVESTAQDSSQPLRKLTDLRPAPRDGDLPLSFAQQRLWFLDQWAPGSSLYNVPAALRLSGRLNVKALEQSLNEIVRRHEALRTTFATVDGRPTQVIAPELKLNVPVVDLQHLRETPAKGERPPQTAGEGGWQAGRDAEAWRLAIEEAQRPFDLAHGPLVRARLFRLHDDEHIFVLVSHHIVFDGWSANVLVREIAALHDAFTTGKPSPLPELPIQYADFAYWQRQRLQTEVMEAQLAYWKKQLAGSPPLLELPTDRPRPAAQTYRGERLSFTLPAELSSALRELSRREGATLFMTMLAAFKALLYRYTGQEDISVGTPVANRNRAEIEQLIGFFVNTLVLRTDVSGDPGLRDLLKRVSDTAVGAFDHQDLPFEMLVDELQPQRDMSHAPLFQVMFTLQNAPMQALKLQGLTLKAIEPDTSTAKFDLTLLIVDRANGLAGTLEYNTDLFDATTIQRMIGHFQTLLSGIVAQPDRPISQLPLLTVAERRQLLVEWNNTTVDYPHNQCIHRLFEAQVARTPDAVAVVYENQSLTYGELNDRANRLAHYLRRLGIGQDRLVGVCFDRSVEMIVSVLGILKAGGAYLPLDPTYPIERLAFMLEDSQAPVLLTQSHWLAAQNVPAGVSEIVCLDTDWNTISVESSQNPNGVTTADNLAYVIYTSGSTGRPKGVMIQHRSVLNLFTGLNRAIYANHPQRPMRISLNAPLPFDASVQQWVMLLNGHSLYIVPQEARQDGNALLTYIRRNKLDVLDCVPSQLKLLLAAGLLDGTEWAPSIVLPGGEAIDEATWQRMAQAEGTDFYNMYGPTECTVDSTACRVKTASVEPTIGRPIANARFYILDAHLQPVPIGVPGELHVGGAGPARGYLNRPELTVEKFLADPFSHEPGARMYKTGDRVRYRPDGNVEFLGRIDYQVKVRGFRIELGEIESVLQQHPALREVVVLVREDTPGDKRLVAYAITAQQPAPTTSELRAFVKDKLPEYMIPSAFVLLDAMPLTPNRKVDRRALPVPDPSRPELEAVYAAPRTSEEETLAGIWAQILGVRQVGIHDNFFELGGDSILSIQVISRAAQAGLHLTPRQLFEHPTVESLAAVADKGGAIQAEQGIVEGPVPLTPIQHWFFDLKLAEPHHWNQALLIELRHPLDWVWLHDTLAHLLAHHDALRLRFELDALGERQVNADNEAEVPVTWFDLSGLAPDERRSAVETRAAELQASLNLSSGPLLRAAYFDLGREQPGRLLLVIHHLAIDGVSWRILLEDFQTIYQQLSRGESVRLPAKTTSFKDWAQRLDAYAQTDAARDEMSYWLNVLGGRTVRLPVDRPGGDNTEASARSVTIALTTEETRALLQDVPPVYGTEINDVLLTALAQAFERWSGSRTLWVELEGHGREELFEEADVSRTVGWFTSTFPARLELKNDGLGEALKSIKERLRRIPRHGIGFGLLRYLSQDKTLAKTLADQAQSRPEPEVVFNYLGQIDQTLAGTPFAIAPESVGASRSLRNRRTHLLSINGSVAGGRLQMEWSYSENVHRRATIEKLAHDFVDALRSIIAHCQSPEAGGYTPSDFADVELSQADIDALLAETAPRKDNA